MHQSQSVDTLPARTPDASSTASQSTSKRLVLSRSFTGLPTVSMSPPREATKITLGTDGADAVFAISQRNRLYQILKRLSTIVSIPEDEVRLVAHLSGCAYCLSSDWRLHPLTCGYALSWCCSRSSWTLRLAT